MAHDLPNPLAWAIGAFRDDAQAQRYELAARYLDGDQDLAFATSKYQSAFGNLFTAFAYNRCAAVVDAHTDRLHLNGFDADSEDVAMHAQDIWDRNEMDVRFNEFVGEGMAVGDSYLLVWPDQETGEATIWPEVAAEVRAHYGHERPGQLRGVAKAWRDDALDNRMRLNLYTDGLIERYVTKTKIYSGIPSSPGAFVPYDDDGEAVVTHDWGIPIAHYANNGRTGRYGRSELRDVIPIQDALNKTMTDQLVAMELMAYPQRVILGMEGEDTETGQAIDKFVAGMSRILTLSTGASIDQFAAADLAKFVAVAEFLDVCIARVSKVPVHYLTMSGNFPSGRALRTAEAPFVAKLEDRQRALGGVITRAMRTALAIEGVQQAEGLKVVWKSAAPLSEEDTWDIAIQKRAAGLPLPQILAEAGYEADDVDEIMGMAADLETATMRAFDAGRFAGDEPDVAA